MHEDSCDAYRGDISEQQLQQRSVFRQSVFHRIAVASHQNECLHWIVKTRAAYPVNRSVHNVGLEGIEGADEEEETFFRSKYHTALTLACLCCEASAARVLLEVQGGVRWADRRLMFFPISAIHRMNPADDGTCRSVLEVLAEQGADFATAGLDPGGHCLLSLASQASAEQTVKFLFQQRGVAATVNGVVGEGGRCRVPLVKGAHIIDESSLSIASLLLQHGADPNQAGITEEKLGLSMRGEVLMTALQLTVSGMEWSSLDEEESDSEEFSLAEHHRFQMVRLLIAHGASCLPACDLAPPPNADESGLPPRSRASPLLIACLNDQADLVRFMCEKGGADPTLPGAHYEEIPEDYPIAYLVRFWKCDMNDTLSHRRERDWKLAQIVDLLLDLGADPNKKMKDNAHPPKEVARRRRFFRTAEALNRRGAKAIASK
uniref:Uncharacterized protein n=1 Tax=Chromera velia CCMP2878 TaxID=1169474 RepID=A0A0G4FK36_9ALVE|eukprot:Cvel_17368.t1-p1 / transcript=Cvel_17368.t1 / gene=Cvel_17368 / organism=Chromera_velia_CCMP2878 / gene_product=hypothetical protein / transcript_product=hypothetical protein / location=Cvel_scaffold1380:33158-34453(-) / protein_length=432 / sequence_SO=supercontig / SO=protein_coding / is_pseudo=false